jgi:hypothetical protein
MLIKLPVNHNGRSMTCVFQITFDNNDIIVKPYLDDNNLIKICLYHKFYGLCEYAIYFPLIFKKYNNLLVNELFFIFALMYDEDIINNSNFLSLLVNKINTKLKTIYTIPKLSDFNKKFLEYIIKNYNNNNNTLDNYDNIDHFLTCMYLKVQYHLNLSLFIIYMRSHNSINDYAFTKKININIKNLYNFTFEFFGNINTLENHIHFIKYPEKLLINNYYFITRNNKILKVYLNKITPKSFIINNNKELVIDKYIITPYPNNYKDDITIDMLFKKVVNYKLMDLIGKNIYKKHPLYRQILEYFYSDNQYEKLALVKLLSDKFITIEPKYSNIMSNVSILMDENISFESFKQITDINNKFDINVLKCLLEQYTYPIYYNKRTLAPTFAKILYYSFKFNKDIVANKSSVTGFFTKEINEIIGPKIKYIYTTFIRIYIKINSRDLAFIYNSKLYTDYLHFTIFNILLHNDNFNLLEKNKFFYLIRNKFINNIILLQAINLLTWKNISKKTSYLKFILTNKLENNKLLFYENNINKYILENDMDSRIKRVIVDPLTMFNYLKTERDYIKWIFFLDNEINKLFYNPIKLTTQEHYILGKMIYMLFKVKTQNLDDKTYTDTLEYCKKHQNLILYKDRINIRLKDIYKNSPINLGYLAKHLYTRANSSITLTDEIEYTIDDLENKLIQVTRRYYKYKSKYLNIKLSELSSNIDI